MAGVQVGVAHVDVVPVPKVAGFDKKLAKELEPASRTASQKMASVGSGLTKTLTPAAGAFGLFARSAFKEFDAGADAVRAGTGATGEALDGLIASMKTVGGQSTQGLSEVGVVLADLNTRLGLTGEPLEALTKQLLELDRIGNAASAETVSRVFGDWGVAAEDSGESLDKLFRASQATGPSVDRLGQMLVSYGAPMRQLGFSFEESAALLGKFEKEGVNTELVMGSMRQALGKMAREGEPAIETFERVAGEIKNAGSASEANAMALELFGARAGPDMAASIREGRFEIDDLVGQIEGGTDTIEQVAEDTESWNDKLAKLKNRAQTVIGPVGEVGMALAGVAAGLGPAISGAAKLGPVFGKLGGAAKATGRGVASAGRMIRTGFTAAMGAIRTAVAKTTAFLMANPWVLAIAAAVAITVLLIKNWDKVKKVLIAIWDAIKAVATAVWGAIHDFLTGLWEKVKEVATAVWNGIYDAVAEAIDAVLRFITETIPKIASKLLGWAAEFITFAVTLPIKFYQKLLGFYVKLGEFFIGGVALIAEKLLEWTGAFLGWAGELGGKIIDRLERGAKRIIGWVADLPGKLAEAGSAMWDWLSEGFKAALNSLIKLWNKADLTFPRIEVPDWVPGIGGKGFGGFDVFPDFPLLAAGGTTTTAGGVIVGDAGPELLDLPAEATVRPLDGRDRAVSFENHFYGTDLSAREIADEIAWLLRTTGR